MRVLAFLTALMGATSAVFWGAGPAESPAADQQPPARDTKPLGLSTTEDWREGRETLISIFIRDPDIVSVAVLVSAERIHLGGKARGTVTEVIAEAQPPPLQMYDGTRAWEIPVTPPYLDSSMVTLAAKGFNADGEVMEATKLQVPFIAAVVPEEFTDGLLVSKKRQRLYALSQGRVVEAYLISTGRVHRDGGGPTPSMKTRIINKHRNAWSPRYEVNMPYWNAITRNGRYGIHATSSSFYRKLGTADSHGCVRLHLNDARELYHRFPVGTPVVVR